MSFDDEIKKAESNIRRLAKKAGDRSAAALVDASHKARDRAVNRIADQVLLDKSYIRQRIEVLAAKKDELGWSAEVRAFRRGVLLTRFAHTAVFGPRKSGDGQKQVGISGQITPQKSYRSSFFYIALKSGAMGIAKRTERTGRDNYKVLYGPSVSQVYASVREDIAGEVQLDLQQALQSQLEQLYG